MKTFELLGEELIQVHRKKEKENRKLSDYSTIEKMSEEKSSFVSKKAFRELFPEDDS